MLSALSPITDLDTDLSNVFSSAFESKEFSDENKKILDKFSSELLEDILKKDLMKCPLKVGHFREISLKTTALMSFINENSIIFSKSECVREFESSFQDFEEFRFKLTDEAILALNYLLFLSLHINYLYAAHIANTELESGEELLAIPYVEIKNTLNEKSIEILDNTISTKDFIIFFSNFNYAKNNENLEIDDMVEPVLNSILLELENLSIVNKILNQN